MTEEGLVTPMKNEPIKTPDAPRRIRVQLIQPPVMVITATRRRLFYENDDSVSEDVQ